MALCLFLSFFRSLLLFCMFSLRFDIGAAKAPQKTPHDYYKKLCIRPKTCTRFDRNGTHTATTEDPGSVPKVTCSLDILRGLALTKELMQLSQSSDGSGSLSREDIEGHHLNLAHVRLEEAAVGCTLIWQEVESGNTDSLDLCPLSRTCGAESNPCSRTLLHHLQKSVQTLDAVAQNLDALSPQEALGKRLEAADVRAEEAAVGCILMQQKVNEYRENAKKSSKNKNGRNKQTNDFTQNSNYDNTFERKEKNRSREQVDQWLTEYFPAEMREIERMKSKRLAVEEYMSFTGYGEIPEMTEEERSRREAQIRNLIEAEASLRKKLMFSLNLRRYDKILNESSPDDFSNGEQECVEMTNSEGSCGDDNIDGRSKMEEDLSRLKSKAKMASTMDERNVLLGLVNKMEEQLALFESREKAS